MVRTVTERMFFFPSRLMTKSNGKAWRSSAATMNCAIDLRRGCCGNGEARKTSWLPIYFMSGAENSSGKSIDIANVAFCQAYASGRGCALDDWPEY